jgi:hypothetical protein
MSASEGTPVTWVPELVTPHATFQCHATGRNNERFLGILRNNATKYPVSCGKTCRQPCFLACQPFARLTTLYSVRTSSFRNLSRIHDQSSQNRIVTEPSHINKMATADMFPGFTVLTTPYKLVNGHEILAGILIPDGLPSGKRPVIVRMHGGFLVGCPFLPLN